MPVRTDACSCAFNLSYYFWFLKHYNLTSVVEIRGLKILSVFETVILTNDWAFCLACLLDCLTFPMWIASMYRCTTLFIVILTFTYIRYIKEAVLHSGDTRQVYLHHKTSWWRFSSVNNWYAVFWSTRRWKTWYLLNKGGITCSFTATEYYIWHTSRFTAASAWYSTFSWNLLPQQLTVSICFMTAAPDAQRSLQTFSGFWNLSLASDL